MQRQQNRQQDRKGVGLIYSIVILLALTAVASLALDYGRVQMVKTQLRAAADAAARAAAHDVPFDQGLAKADAVAYAQKNLADGTPVVLDPSDITIGYRDTTARTFAATVPSGKTANAVQVFARRLKSRNNGVPLIMANVLGFGSCNVQGAVDRHDHPADHRQPERSRDGQPVPRGHAAGQRGQPKQPAQQPGLCRHREQSQAVPACHHHADQTDGTGPDVRFHLRRRPSRSEPGVLRTPTGSSTRHRPQHQLARENGIGDVDAPINALVGVFLDDSQPNFSAAPAMLDFSTQRQPRLHEASARARSRSSSSATV